jgi:hypothetical protein
MWTCTYLAVRQRRGRRLLGLDAGRLLLLRQALGALAHVLLGPQLGHDERLLHLGVVVGMAQGGVSRDE